MEEVEQQPQPEVQTTETETALEDKQIQINPPKSKSQIKKEIAKQKWLADKQMRKDRQKAKKKENQEKRRLEMEANPEKRVRPPRAEGEEHNIPNKKIKADYKKMVSEGQPIIVDCCFQDKLNDKETISLCRQICYSHAANKKMSKPVKLIISSCTGKIRDQLVKMGAENWGIILLEKHYLEYYPKDKLVYLTGDCNEDITDLQMDTAYIIGGLVDHNRYKFATLNKAKEEGLVVKRLPISQHVSLKSSTILSVNHVFDIMLKVANGEGWDTAIKASIPDRKREDAPKKGQKEETKGEEEEGEEEDLVDDDEEEIEEKEETEQANDQSAPEQTIPVEGTNAQAGNTENNEGENQKAE